MFSEMTVEIDSNAEKWTSSRPRQRRIQGACDVCKRRKIRCDSSEMPGNRCSHCTNMGLDCTHVDLMKTSTSAKGYVAALESRVEKLERLLNKLLPGINLTEHLENDVDVEPLLPHSAETPLQRNDEESLSGGLRKLKLDPEQNRFFGKSSGVQLVQTALNFKSHFSGIPHSYPILPNKRENYWAPVPWLLPPPDENPLYTFPDPDLLTSLVNLYFKEVNPCSPVLHRPTFKRKLAANLHIRDHRFAATVLMVCSLGARHSDDPRVLLEGETTRHSAGHKWHSQVSVIPKHLIYKPDLYELQTIALSAMFLMAISPTALCWNQIGFGLRRAQDVGAHRRNAQPRSKSLNEQWNRVFWVLLCLEWQFGTITGRPLAMHDQDFDQEFPLDCDDEYWDLNFEQPKDKPSEISYFIHCAKLLEIQAAVTTTLYSARKPKDLYGRSSPHTDTQNIMAFDSALNSWLLEVPEHLWWDPKRKNTLHFKQSALLYTAYYNVQILVHRPYIPTPRTVSLPGAHPSLAICTNAARSCARIFDAQDQLGIPVHPGALPVVFTAGVVLLLHAWSGKRSGFADTSSKELELVQTCLKLATAAEERYIAAGRYKDVLNRLLHAGDNLDLLFDMKPISTAPPLPQRGYEAFTPQPTSQAASTVTHEAFLSRPPQQSLDVTLDPRSPIFC
ncbi:fungal-specific transcription factor domain-containing protein [Mycena rosella]|uniref:Fungal-specific transcription factor domain-containing protein n=1 Tax=Mycena rosella TaxID=1033263 RepID=A0AAD7GG36_MYCRO|nr:fungal-specific transcription factor domain-containing protein [Mycena rosella]